MLRRWLVLAAACAAVAFGAACSKSDAAGTPAASVKPAPAPAPIHVAVAANFAIPLERIGEAFRAKTKQDIVVSSGSTGKLYAQIDHGAPFHVFLAADSERPRLLEERGVAVEGSRFTYAMGRLALCGKALEHASDGPRALTRADVEHVAIANPKTAPYGAAARQALEKLGHWAALESRMVQGENITQTHQFVSTGAAELGFVALSSVVDEVERCWLVPQELHDPIRQDAVLLERGNPAGKPFLEFLKSAAARALVEKAGYSVP